jgi:hypothetical protein
MNFFRILADIFTLILGEWATMSRRLAKLGLPGGNAPARSPWMGVKEQMARVYLGAIRRLLIIIAVIPIPLLAIGIWGEIGWLVAMVGLLWAIPTLILTFVATPIGLLINLLKEEDEKSATGSRYMRMALGLLFAEMSFALLLVLVPVRNNLAALPVLAIAAAIIGILNFGVKAEFFRSLMKTAATITIVAMVVSFYFPRMYGMVGRWMGTWDERMYEKAAPYLGETTAVPTAGTVSQEGMDSAPRMHVSQVAGVGEEWATSLVVRDTTVVLDRDTVVTTTVVLDTLHYLEVEGSGPFEVVWSDFEGQDHTDPVPGGPGLYSLRLLSQAPLPQPLRLRWRGEEVRVSLKLARFPGL